MIHSFLKYPGSKYKLLPWILDIINGRNIETWYEPFVGSCNVALNVKAKRYVLSDLNETIINIYKSIQNKSITSDLLYDYLYNESNKLKTIGEKYYYNIREYYNKTKNQYAFIFLNHTGFNGLIRYNSKQQYNTPFCKNINVLTESRINNIIDNINNFYNFVSENDVQFISASYDSILKSNKYIKNDFIYCDPPYIFTSVGYIGKTWGIQDEDTLYNILDKTKCNFIVSSWNNENNDNYYLTKLCKKYKILTKEYKYVIGSKNRIKNINEILITNISLENYNEINYEEMFK